MNAIRTIGLEYFYPDGTMALSDVDFEAGTGEKIAVLGPNGSGKTTLFYHFNGLISPTSGRVEIFGESISKSNIDHIRRRVGLVFQDPESQLFAPTVSEDIGFGPRNLKLEPEEINSRVRQVMKRFDIEGLALKNPSSLSGGQKKRVAIAGVVAMQPDVLVLDEPTSGMDGEGTGATIEILDELNNEGKTIIISTHDSELAASWADRIYVLNKGKIFRSGPPAQIFSDEKLMCDASLRHPVIVQTFREFQARGISKGEVPLSVIDFMGSVDARIMKIRCAIAGCDVSADDEVFLEMKNGMLTAMKGPGNVRGKVVSGGKEGDDIAVKDVVGDLHQSAGRITIFKVPGITEGGARAADIERIPCIFDRLKDQKIGAMGTTAKVLMGRIGIKLDFEFDVIQSSMLAALRGFDVAIFASGGMAERAAEKIKVKKIKCSIEAL